ncbi:MAG TPA: hypothetical protein VGB89_13355, partial [Bacteroidota bacterium]
ATTIAGLTIQTGGSLAVDGANFNASTISNSGSLSVAATRTLTLTGSLTNVTPASSFSLSGTGTLTTVTNNGSFSLLTGGSAAMSGIFNNNLGATLNTVGTGSLVITGADIINAGTISNAGSITVQ